MRAAIIVEKQGNIIYKIRGFSDISENQKPAKFYHKLRL
ncbi:hypothetical protein SPLC1_S205250 [Arthrospira platensis C1]|uniref:Uncharacterized protein n=1 Tax=Limnospira maxima CS-328 TaxID=513049 RepID=B5W802_LIMMA|nr:hypothetical protein AmaxDRAFT_4902 [Limnospira maxima CS-328]EKD09124.1 hypothetical protein SPLC1_S205250 [Arthrospira platensis C1]